MSRDLMERFAASCGVTGPWVVTVHDDGGVHRARRIFHQPFLVCGRHPDADLELEQGGVGRRHCYLQAIGGRIFAIDLGSSTGIELGGVACRSGWLDGSRELRLGPVGLTLRSGDDVETVADRCEGPSPLSAQSAQARSLPEVTLEIGDGGGRRVQSWTMSQELVLVGRSTACQLRLLSPLVADIHCALLRTESGLWLVDLLAPGGVFVDGTAVRVACLAAGAEVGLGPFTLRVREGRGVGGSSDGDQSKTFRAASETSGSLADRLDQVRLRSRSLAASLRDRRDAMRDTARELGGLAEELRRFRSELERPPAHWGNPSDLDTDPGSELEIGPELGDESLDDFDWQAELELSLRLALAEQAASSSRFREPAHAVADWQRAERRASPVHDPRVHHAIATEFLSSYRLESRSLRKRVLRAFLRSPGTVESTHGPHSR